MNLKHSNRNRNGAIIPLLALVITALLIIAALTINSNWLMYSQVNAQNAADISARSSLVKITEDTKFDGRIDRARALGVRLYELNLDRPNADFSPDRIQFGHIDDSSALEPVLIPTNNGALPITAVHVDTADKKSQREVKVYLSNFLSGRKTVEIFSEAKASVQPIDLILCLDASRSMNRLPIAEKAFPPGGTTIHEPPLPGSRWFELEETVDLFLTELRGINPNARVGLVTFGGGASQKAIDKHGVESDLDHDLARLETSLTVVVSPGANAITETLASYGTDNPALGLGTSLYDGIELSVSAFDNAASVKHIIMLSDGQQAAVSRPEPLVAAEAAADQGIVIHTISLGGSFDVMDNIADETNGTKFSALNEEELKESFSRLIGRFRTKIVD